MSACPFCPKGPDTVRLTQRPQRWWERKGRMARASAADSAHPTLKMHIYCLTEL